MRPEIILIGQWLFDQDQRALYTMWAGQKLVISLGNIASAKTVQVAVHARNRGRIPATYTAFLIDMHRSDRDGNLTSTTIGTVSVPASDSDYRVGIGQALLQPGTDVYLALVWNNDFYDPDNGFDANIVIRDVLVY